MQHFELGPRLLCDVGLVTGPDGSPALHSSCIGIPANHRGVIACLSNLGCSSEAHGLHGYMVVHMLSALWWLNSSSATATQQFHKDMLSGCLIFVGRKP